MKCRLPGSLPCPRSLSRTLSAPSPHRGALSAPRRFVRGHTGPGKLRPPARSPLPDTPACAVGASRAQIDGRLQVQDRKSQASNHHNSVFQWPTPTQVRFRSPPRVPESEQKTLLSPRKFQGVWRLHAGNQGQRPIDTFLSFHTYISALLKRPHGIFVASLVPRSASLGPDFKL